MRKWRKSREVTEEQRTRTNIRAYTNVLVRRGKLSRQPCALCGDTKVEAHHPRYQGDTPGRLARQVVWLCRKHHKAFHSVAHETSKEGTL